MIRVSSNLTLPLKIFVPTTWIVFFGLLTFAIVLSSGEDNPLFANIYFKTGAFTFFAFFMTLIYFTLMKLLRVEFGDGVFTATNYFKNYRYSFDDVDQINEYDIILKKVIRIRMKADTKFGKNIYFLRSASLYDAYMQSHSELKTSLVK